MLSTCKTRSGNKLSQVRPLYSAIQSLHHSSKINEGCMNLFQLRLWTVTQIFTQSSTAGLTINALKICMFLPLASPPPHAHTQIFLCLGESRTLLSRGLMEAALTCSSWILSQTSCLPHLWKEFWWTLH